MNRFRNILVVPDPRPEEDSALQRAAALARANGARVTLFETIPDVPWEADPQIAGVDLAEAVCRERARQLEELAEPYRAQGLEIAVEVRTGKPFVEIVRAVLRGGHDLVVKTARGELGLTKRLFGTTALHLMRKCPCPVWIVKPGFRAPHRRILAAVDPTGSPEAVALDRKLLELTTTLAQREESEVHVVHAWRVEDAVLSGRLPRRYVKEMTEHRHDEHMAAFEDLLAAHDDRGLTHHRHFERGAPDRTIVAKAEELDVDLVVMGTVRRTGLTGFFIGSTAEEVLSRVNCSVLAVKPDGFVSPVTLEEDHARARA